MPRNPFPFPCYENERSFNGNEPSHQTFPRNFKPVDNVTWDRLHQTHTLQSMRRSYFSYDEEEPKDSLDFALKSYYDHHSEFLKDTNETLLQAETLNKPHKRILRNRPKTTPAKIDLKKLPIKTYQSSTKENPNRVKGAIEGHHNAVTNNGFSRKFDGGFYTS
ncbi:Uncharacterized protein C1orf194-like protein [Trichoplax sp. H2]|nr:Uncharacterized protein C1orf194-like protein [Trichoplax sp. H2]|eukprot:RDD47077.1 Uncharacterized protein C1orf194-like protein [Trichoplax sp. H2]